ncbi:hypothetical protein BJ742DRAFT_852824 [Cladochytrium replicatum]|nr:hypothetical protein BJ742DRAFT_852824 [Cladochytrium replicatum]
MSATVENPAVISKDKTVPPSAAQGSAGKSKGKDSLTNPNSGCTNGQDVGTPDDCAICLDEVEPRGKLPIINPGCGHLFHLTCLAKSVRRNHLECPCCRAPLPPDVITVGYLLPSPRSSPVLGRGVVQESMEAGGAAAAAAAAAAAVADSIPARVRQRRRAPVSPTRGSAGSVDAAAEIQTAGRPRVPGLDSGTAPNDPRVRASQRRLFPDPSLFPDLQQAESTLENLYALAEANRNIYSDFAQFIEAARTRQPNQPNVPLGRYRPASSAPNVGQNASAAGVSPANNNEPEIIQRRSPLRRSTRTSGQQDTNPRLNHIFRPGGAPSLFDSANVSSSSTHIPFSLSNNSEGFNANSSATQPFWSNTSSGLPTGVHPNPSGESASTHLFRSTNGSNPPNFSFSRSLRGQQEDPSVNYIFPTDGPSQQTWNSGGAANSSGIFNFAPADPTSSGSGFRFNVDPPVAAAGNSQGIPHRFNFGNTVPSTSSAAPPLFSTTGGTSNAPLFSSTRSGLSNAPPLFSTASSGNIAPPLFSAHTSGSGTSNAPPLFSNPHHGSNPTSNNNCVPFNPSFQWPQFNGGSSPNRFTFGTLRDNVGGRSTGGPTPQQFVFSSSGPTGESFSAGSTSSQEWQASSSGESSEGNSSSRYESSPRRHSTITERPTFNFASSAAPQDVASSSLGNTLRRSPAFVNTVPTMNAPMPNFSTRLGNDGSGGSQWQATPSFMFPAFTPTQAGPSFGSNIHGVGPSPLRFTFDSPATTPPNAPQIPPSAINAEAIEAAQTRGFWNHFGLGGQDVHIVQQQQQQQQQQQEQRVEQQPQNIQQQQHPSPINVFQLPPMPGVWDPARSAWEDNSTY